MEDQEGKLETFVKRPETVRQVEFGPRQWEQPPSHLSSRELETLDQQTTCREGDIMSGHSYVEQ